MLKLSIINLDALGALDFNVLEMEDKMVVNDSYESMIGLLGSRLIDNNFYKTKKKTVVVVETKTSDKDTLNKFATTFADKLRSFGIYDYEDYSNIITLEEGFKIDGILREIFKDIVKPVMDFNSDTYYLSLTEAKLTLRRLNENSKSDYELLMKYINKVKRTLGSLKLRPINLDEEGNLIKLEILTDFSFIKSDELYKSIGTIKLNKEFTKLTKSEVESLYNVLSLILIMLVVLDI